MRLKLLLFIWPVWSVLPSQTNAPASFSTPALPQPDARLFAAFDSAYVFQVQKSNPTLLRRWNFYLDNAYFVADFPPEKGDIETLPVVTIENPSYFNILKLEQEQSLHHNWDVPTFYRINHSRQVLIFLPGKEFNRKFNALSNPSPH